MEFRLKGLWFLLKETYKAWDQDDAMRLGAALSYYTIFSLPGLLFLVIAIAGLAFGEDAARGQIVNEIQGLIGKIAAETVQTMIARAGESHGQGILGIVIGGIIVIISATGVFGELQFSLNKIWRVQKKPDAGIMHMVFVRILSFGLIFLIGIILLVTLAASAAISALGSYFRDIWQAPAFLQFFIHAADFIVSFGIMTFLFALIFRYLPDSKIPWKDIWYGSLFTALLFTFGKFLIGLYLGKSSVSSEYGAAGSLILILLWIYYSALIFFFGAEFTRVFAGRSGSVFPNKYAMNVQKQEDNQ